MFNKKGVSAIIATVLLILITIATVTIVWTVVVPMVQDNLGQAESFTDCIYAAEQFQILENENACYTLNENEITLNIPVKLGGRDFNFYGVQVSSSVRYDWNLGGAGEDNTGSEELILSEKIIDDELLPPLGGTATLELIKTGNNLRYATNLDLITATLTVLTMRNDKESSCGDTTKTITLSACPLA